MNVFALIIGAALLLLVLIVVLISLYRIKKLKASFIHEAIAFDKENPIQSNRLYPDHSPSLSNFPLSDTPDPTPSSLLTLDAGNTVLDDTDSVEPAAVDTASVEPAAVDTASVDLEADDSDSEIGDFLTESNNEPTPPESDPKPSLLTSNTELYPLESTSESNDTPKNKNSQHTDLSNTNKQDCSEDNIYKITEEYEDSFKGISYHENISSE
jgi:hypothetical protein